MSQNDYSDNIEFSRYRSPERANSDTSSQSSIHEALQFESVQPFALANISDYASNRRVIRPPQLGFFQPEHISSDEAGLVSEPSSESESDDTMNRGPRPNGSPRQQGPPAGQNVPRHAGPPPAPAVNAGANAQPGANAQQGANPQPLQPVPNQQGVNVVQQQQGAGAVPGLQRQASTTPDPEDLKIVDKPIPSLPPFPYANYKDNELATSSVSPKTNAIQQLSHIYQSYDTTKNLIESLEYYDRGNVAARDPNLTNRIQANRNSLYKLFTSYAVQLGRIQRMEAIQRSQRPHLKMPTDHPYDDEAIRPSISDIKSYVKGNSTNQVFDSTSEELRQIWNKLLSLSEYYKLTHSQFRAALPAVFTGEILEHLQENSHLGLQELVDELADRFLTATPYSKALDELKNFTRGPNESIRQCFARLQSYITKACILYPDEQKKAITDFQLLSTLRELVSPKVKEHLIIKENESIAYGAAKITPKQLVQLIESTEKAMGTPNYPISTPVSVNNTEVTPITQPLQPIQHDNAELDAFKQETRVNLTQISEQIGNLTNMFQNMAATQHEVNVAMKNVNFKDPEHPPPPVRAPTPYNFSDPSNKLPKSEKPRSSSRSNRDRSEDRRRYPSYDKYMDSSSRRSRRDSHRDSMKKHQADSRFNEQMANRGTSQSPATYYRNKAAAAEQKVVETEKKFTNDLINKLAAPHAALPEQHKPQYQPQQQHYQTYQGQASAPPQPYYNQPPPTPNYPPPTQPPHYRDRTPPQGERWEKTLARLQAKELRRRMDQEYYGNRRSNNQRSDNTNRSASPGHPTNYPRPSSRSNSASRNSGYNKSTYAYTGHSNKPPIINAHPYSNVTVMANCPSCNGPKDHPVELCYAAREHVDQILQEENSNGPKANN